MQFDLRELAARDRYKLLTSLVVPRPIAFVTTLNTVGKVNAAPFSFFNLMGSDPPIIVFGPSDRAPGQPKDTPANIRQSGEFVVNIVDEAIATQMNICAVDFPTGVDELTLAGLTTLPSTQVRPPRIAQAPASLECREHSTLEIGRNRIVVGEVLHLHICDDLVDASNLHIDPHRLRALGRLQGSWYARTSDLFEMPRFDYEEWQRRQSEGTPGEGASEATA